MNDPVSSARSARELLARGLSALQAPGIPLALQNAAEPIAQAMGSLHQIEASHGAAAAAQAPIALEAARAALNLLQTHPEPHPAIEQAMESVASSLSLIHQLTRITSMPAPVAAPAPAPVAAPAPAAAWGAGATMIAPDGPAQAMPTPAVFQQPAAPQPAAFQQPAPAPAGAGQLQQVAAELGAHSATNFYKGLSGNDVIDSGGIFVATYVIPTIGQSLLLKVSMPGGYEFEAVGVVRWTRDAPASSQGGLDAPPGFGAQFTQISPEGRQLVYRYVRNREPLFHDDL